MHEKDASEDQRRNFEIIVLRLDPKYFDFVLQAAGEHGTQAKTLEEWADAGKLQAAINASMFLPDGLTSTGYMRSGNYENNPHIAKNFGSFFLEDKKEPGLPNAQLVDRTVDDWENLLTKYGLVIQNYRLISAAGRVLWAPGGPEYAIAAVGADHSGRILFILSCDPMPGEDFARILLNLNLDLRMAMYVEGGSHASLLARLGEVSTTWLGRWNSDYIPSGTVARRMPNAIGAKRSTPISTPENAIP
jgi:hypothetical protein